MVQHSSKPPTPVFGLDFWRAPTDNDRAWQTDEWKNWGLDMMKSRLVSFEAERSHSGGWLLTSKLDLSPPILAWGFNATMTFNIAPTGTLSVHTTLAPWGQEAQDPASRRPLPPAQPGLRPRPLVRTRPRRILPRQAVRSASRHLARLPPATPDQLRGPPKRTAIVAAPAGWSSPTRAAPASGPPTRPARASAHTSSGRPWTTTPPSSKPPATRAISRRATACSGVSTVTTPAWGRRRADRVRGLMRRSSVVRGSLPFTSNPICG